MSLYTPPNPAVGTLAAWLASNPVLPSGALALISNSKVLVQGDGATKMFAAGTPAFGFANAKSFGAIADGASHPLSGYFASLAAAQSVYPHATALTDEIDWCAIQAAINSLPSSLHAPSGGTVYIPRGKYAMSSEIAPGYNCTLLGDGGGNADGSGTYLDWTIAAVPPTATPGIHPFNCGGVRIRGLALKGPTGAAGANAYGISLDWTSHAVVEDCYIDGFRCGICLTNANHVRLVHTTSVNGYAGGLRAISALNLTIQSCLWSNASFGPNVDLTTGTENVLIIDNLIDECFANQAALRILGARHVVVVGTHIYSTDTGYGILLGDGANNPTDCHIYGCRIEPFGNNGGPYQAILVRGSNHTISDCTLLPRGGQAIADSGVGTQITGTAVQAVVRGSGGAFAAMAGETFDFQLDALGWVTVTFGAQATVAAAVARINAYITPGQGGASEDIANAGQVDIWSGNAGLAGRVRTRNVTAGVTAKLGIPNNADSLGAIRNTLPALGGMSYANNAAALAAGLVAGDLYTVTGSDPLQVAVAY